MPEFISLVYSPWSEKARWALEHHGVPCKHTPFQPLIDEPVLRWRMHQWSGPISVPVFFDGNRWLSDSWDIARHAEDVGSGAPLFPEGRVDEVKRFDALSQTGLESGRAALTRMLDDEDLLRTMVPKPLRSIVGPLGIPIARAGLQRTLRKYHANALTPTQHRERMQHVLRTLRETLDGQGKAGDKPRYLLGQFSYADIAACQVLQLVSPANLGGFRMEKQGLAGYRDTKFEADFPDLCDWRLALYENHHPTPHGRKR